MCGHTQYIERRFRQQAARHVKGYKVAAANPRVFFGFTNLAETLSPLGGVAAATSSKSYEKPRISKIVRDRS